MSEPSSVLASYVHALRLLSAAESVTLYQPAAGGEPAAGLLLHAGRAAPVPELTDRTTAAAFARRIRSDPRWRAPRSLGTVLQIASEERHCRLLCVPSVETQLSVTEGIGGQRRRRSDRSRRQSPITQAWIGIRFPSETIGFPPLDAGLQLRLEPPDAPRDPGSWSWILAFGGALVWTSHLVTQSLHDPVSGLPSRVELQSVLESLIDRARADNSPLTLALFNPDGFGSINDHLGRETGDRVIREISERLRSLHRATDFVARYGGAVFAAVLVESSLRDGQAVAEKVRRRLSESPLLEAKLTLSFTAGLAALSPSELPSPQAAAELLRLADAALGVAKREGGDRTAAWDEGIRGQEAESHDRLRGIFTADVARDYRNMALLLDTLRSVATAEDVSNLLTAAVARIASTFRPLRAGVFRCADGGGLRLAHAVSAEAGRSEPVELAEWTLSRTQRTLATTALEQREPQARATGRSPASRHTSCAVPMLAGTQALGCLVLECREDESLDGHDLHFLGTLASQLAVALDRAELAAIEREHRWRETERIRLELENLRAALESSQLLYRSPQMEELLALARRVAPTDATVLITGESGTGKELLARTIHELSPRRQGPHVVLDCAAIPDTLVESELFGHEKGAFTGADRSKRGRLLEAKGGTVLLDEVSELPLPVQGRLLRFVQEHQLTPVGSEHPVSVDVRVVAATNRDLEAEVEAGRFREDLFHRLNVFRLEVPPLRERPADILYLARHFLSRYALAYGKSLESISPSGEQALLAYDWPGNVRELQHCIMRASILCDGGSLEPHHLVFLDQRPANATAPEPRRSPGRQGRDPGTDADAGPDEPWSPPSWQPLGDALRNAATAALAEPGAPPALGRELQRELLLRAEAIASGVGRQAARLLGIPETTFRRRLASARNKPVELPPGLRPAWAETSAAVHLLLQRAEPGEADLPALAERCLLGVLQQAGIDRTTDAAALLGVSPQTYRRRAAELVGGR